MATAPVLFTLHKGEQIVRLIAISFGFDILVTEAAGRNDDIYRLSVNLNEEAVLPRDDRTDRLFLRQLPISAIGIHTSNSPNPLVRRVTVRLTDASHLVF